MSSQNQLSRYGAISRSIDLAPSAKVFLVGDSDDTTYGIQNLAAEFPPDGDGVARVYSSIEAAVAAASPARGDVVLVAPGSNFAQSDADSWDVEGVEVIGLGNGNNRPTITFNDTAAEITIGASGVRVSNIRFLASVSGISRAIDLDSGFSGHRIDNCEFGHDAAGDDFIVSVRGRGVDNVVIEDNDFLLENAAGPTDGVLLNDANFARVRRNYITGDFTNGGVTLDTDASLNVQIEDNTIVNHDSDGVCIRAGVTSTGLAARNQMATGDTVSIGIVDGGLYWSENYMVNDTAETSAVVPATASQFDT